MTVRTSLVLLAMAALTFGSGCVEEQGSMFISGVLPVTPPACTAAAGGNVYQGAGLLDIGDTGQDGNDYTVALEVTTNLPATLNTQVVQQERMMNPNHPNYGNADTNVIIFQSAEVHFIDEDGAPVAQMPTADFPRESPIGGSVYNVQTTLNARAAIFAPLVTSTEANQLQQIAFTSELTGNPGARANVIARVRAIGRTTGGGTVRSPLFSFPLALCKRCLVGLGTVDGVNCADPNLVLQAVEDSCFFGQDVPSTACMPP